MLLKEKSPREVGGMTKGSLLFVDDEQAILRALLRIFRDSEYQIHLASSGQEGLEILERNPVDLVISDMRMPVMNGQQFLSEVKERYPNVTRLILSGYSDEKETFQAVLAGTAKLYMLKPWDNDKLRATLEQIFHFKKTLENRNLLERIEKMEKLPTLPTLYHELCSLMDKEADIKEIAAKIEQDQVIALRMLRMANSALYGIQTNSVQQAISFLGLTVTKNVVLSCSVFNDMKSDKKLAGFVQSLWDHAVLSNRIMLELSKTLLRKKLKDDYSSVGIVHDIGKIALLNQFGASYIEMIEEAEKNAKTLMELEKDRYGFSHQEMGGYLLNWWNLPYSFVEAALFYHEPMQESIINREGLCLLHIADHYSWQSLRHGCVASLEENVFAKLQIEEKDCEQVVEKILAEKK